MKSERSENSTDEFSPNISLVSSAHGELPGRIWTGSLEKLRRSTGVPNQVYTLQGGPGTGKTSFLIDTAVEFLMQGGSPEEIMFFASSKSTADRIKQEIFDRLRNTEYYAGTTPFVRSIHSWVFNFYRQHEQLVDHPTPRLLAGAEHDRQIREILDQQITHLTQDIKDGDAYWPQKYRPALPMVTFARQLRDFLLRSQERGLDPNALDELGKKYDKDLWGPAGKFLRDFQREQNLAASKTDSATVNASELLHLANNQFQDPLPEVQKFKDKLRLILIDDSQSIAPAAAEFMEFFIDSPSSVFIAGDPAQSVFHFRGENDRFFLKHVRSSAKKEQSFTLSSSYRLGRSVIESVNNLSQRIVHHANPNLRSAGESSLREALPGDEEVLDYPIIDNPDKTRDQALDDFSITIFPSESAQNVAVASSLRNAFFGLHDERVLDIESDAPEATVDPDSGLQWSDMAVIVRQVSASNVSRLRRFLLSQGVPVKVDSTNTVLSEVPLIQSILLVLDSAVRKDLKTSELLQIFEGPLSGLDPLSMQRMERGIARAVIAMEHEGRSPNLNLSDGKTPQAMDYMAAILFHRIPKDQADQLLSFFSEMDRNNFDRVKTIISVAQDSAESTIEETLWAVWDQSGLAYSLQNSALLGGAQGAQADAALDSVMQLFDLAGDYVERVQNARVKDFITFVEDQELATSTRSRQSETLNAVEIIPAHATIGREWKYVLIVDLVEDTWPAKVSRDSIFKQQELVDYIDSGIEPGMNYAKSQDHIAEERRLLFLALGRAPRVSVMGVDGTSGTEISTPSRFLEELKIPSEKSVQQPVERDPDESSDRSDYMNALPRILAPEPFIVDMRTILNDPNSTHSQRDSAAQALHIIADAGIYGADPENWWGNKGQSTSEEIVDEDRGLRLSPSKLETLSECPACYIAGKLEVSQKDTEPMRIGTFVHLLAEFYNYGLGREDAQGLVQDRLAEVIGHSNWYTEKQVAQWSIWIDTLFDWLESRDPDAVSVEKTAQKSPQGTSQGDKPIHSDELDQEAAELIIKHTNSDGHVRDIPVTLKGKLDRVESTAQKNTIVDFKTGKVAPTKVKTAKNPQLSAYQLFFDPEQVEQALLFYPRAGKSGTERAQKAFDAEERKEALGNFLIDALGAVGPNFRIGTHKDHKHHNFEILFESQDESEDE